MVLLQGLASGWPLNSVFLHLAVQGAAGDVQLPCCPAYVPIHLFQDRTNEDTLCVAERAVEQFEGNLLFGFLFLAGLTHNEKLLCSNPAKTSQLK